MIGRDFTITLLAIAVTFVAVLWLQVRHEFRNMLPLYHAALRRINQLRDAAIAKEQAQQEVIVPPPAEDPFLEIADLRRTIVEGEKDFDLLAVELTRVRDELDKSLRSNAALRGTITKLTPKKKVKK